MTYDNISNQMWTYVTGSDSHDNIMFKSAQLCSTLENLLESDSITCQHALHSHFIGELCYSMILYVPAEITYPNISELLWT